MATRTNYFLIIHSDQLFIHYMIFWSFFNGNEIHENKGYYSIEHDWKVKVISMSS